MWALPERRGFGFLRGGSQSPIRLTSGKEAYSSPTPAEKGKQIFAIGREMHGELVRYDSNLRVLVPYLGGISATWVTFARSRRSVAYISYPDSTIWRANPDGSGKLQITFAPFEANGLAWSPDDKWLTFRGKTDSSPWKIYLMPSSKGETRSAHSRRNGTGYSHMVTRWNSHRVRGRATGSRQVKWKGDNPCV